MHAEERERNVLCNGRMVDLPNGVGNIALSSANVNPSPADTYRMSSSRIRARSSISPPLAVNIPDYDAKTGNQ